MGKIWVAFSLIVLFFYVKAIKGMYTKVISGNTTRINKVVKGEIVLTTIASFIKDLSMQNGFQNKIRKIKNTMKVFLDCRQEGMLVGSKL